MAIYITTLTIYIKCTSNVHNMCTVPFSSALLGCMPIRIHARSLWRYFQDSFKFHSSHRYVIPNTHLHDKISKSSFAQLIEWWTCLIKQKGDNNGQLALLINFWSGNKKEICGKKLSKLEKLKSSPTKCCKILQKI
jgi:hypothetical protein